MRENQHTGDEEADLLAELHREDLQRVWEQAMPPCMFPPMRAELGISGPEEFDAARLGDARRAGGPEAGPQ